MTLCRETNGEMKNRVLLKSAFLLLLIVANGLVTASEVSSFISKRILGPKRLVPELLKLPATTRNFVLAEDAVPKRDSATRCSDIDDEIV